MIDGWDDLYCDGRLKRIHGDLRSFIGDDDTLRVWPDKPQEYLVPEHDLLCAGFPCQPFSKSGAQKGFDDLNGTVFRMIAVIIKYRSPRFVMLENVGNFERHDGGNTWRRVRQVLTDLGYDVKATTHVGSNDGGDGLLSPHHLGYPHHRERFIVLAQHVEKVGSFSEARHPFPLIHRNTSDPKKCVERAESIAAERLKNIIAVGTREASEDESAAASINPDRIRCIDHWNALVKRIGEHDKLALRQGRAAIGIPSFPIWGFEIDPWNHYPIDLNPASIATDLLRLRRHRESLFDEIAGAMRLNADAAPQGERSYLARRSISDRDLERWVSTWPRYASSRGEWPRWKQRFIEQNRAWSSQLWNGLDQVWLRAWLDELLQMIPSHQKLEWNCMGGDADIWNHILQFRPSGLRVKRCAYVPALVAMTATQLPIVPVADGRRQVRGRHLLPSEGLALQGFPRNWALPHSRHDGFAALGNAVHVGLIKEVVLTWLFEKDGPYDRRGRPLAPDPNKSVPPPPASASVALQVLALLPELRPEPFPTGRRRPAREVVGQKGYSDV